MLNKRFWMVFALVAVLLAAFNPGLAAAAPPAQDGAGRTITVTGYGAAYGSPDIARVGLGVEGVNSDISVAMDDVTNRMNNVIAALTDAGIAPQDIRTEYFSIYQDYGYGMPMTPDESGVAGAQYRVSTSVVVVIRDTSRVGELLALAVNSGANMVNYTEFNIEDQAGLQAEARQLAVADAQDRAAQLASILGMTVGEPLNVVEGSDVYGAMRGLGGGGGMVEMSAAPPISEGQLSVNMAVTITFALVPAN